MLKMCTGSISAAKVDGRGFRTSLPLKSRYLRYDNYCGFFRLLFSQFLYCLRLLCCVTDMDEEDENVGPPAPPSLHLVADDVVDSAPTSHQAPSITTDTEASNVRNFALFLFK